MKIVLFLVIFFSGVIITLLSMYIAGWKWDVHSEGFGLAFFGGTILSSVVAAIIAEHSNNEHS